jgi:serine phosphatase RsbU (regulator of sigma subunit)
MIRQFNILFLLLTLFLFFALPSLFAVDFFWEEPVRFTNRQGNFPVSASSESISAENAPTDNFSVIAWQESTPNRNQSIASSGQINIYLAVRLSGEEWTERGMIAGPYAYSGIEPSIISLVIDKRDRILIAAAASSAQTEILISADRGKTFSRQTINMGAEGSVAPRIFVRADGGYLLFVTKALSQSLAIYYARSNDGINWSPFELFAPENNLALNFLPAHTSAGSRDIIFFQSLLTDIETSTSFQLYFKTSDNGGQTWSSAKRFTTFNDPVTQTQAPANYFDNQRPHLSKYGNNFLLVWERHYSTQTPQIYSAVIDPNGNISGRVERVNSEEAYCNNPVGFIYKDNPIVVWFDNRRGNNRVIMAQKDNIGWQNQLLSSGAADSSFARPAAGSDNVFIFWQSTVQGTPRIIMLAPDHSVNSPRVTAVNFNPSTPSRSERARFAWNIPFDTSGILGFSWVWSQNAAAQPSRQIMIYNTGNTQNLNMEVNADMDGTWYFSVSAQDYAGNWSAPARISYERKTSPPPALTIIQPRTDNDGYLVSNTFNLAWEPSIDPFVAGYTWNIQSLGNEQAAVSAPPSRIMGTNTSVGYTNNDNGLFAFTVSAIDRAGNIGPQSNIIFRTNKFNPYTSVSFIDASQDVQGTLSIRIIGRGFSSADGRITSVVLENSAGQDIPGLFRILSDREIGGLNFENLEEDQYKLKLQHSARGWYTAPSAISVSRSATVKMGDYSQVWSPSWRITPKRITLNPAAILAAVLVIFCALGIIAAIRGIAGVAAESAAIKHEALAIITGEFMPMEKKHKIARINKRGTGLRFKLASFTIALVLSVIIMISTPMYLIMTSSQRETLLDGLYSRSRVLLEGLASSARAYLPMGDQGAVEMGFLPAQSAALPEAKYITITGYRPGSTHNDHVWATNDPDILSKIDTKEFRPGVSRITDLLTPHYEQLSADLNNRARSEVGELSQSIVELLQEGQSLAIRLDASSLQRIADIQVTIRSLEVNLTERLSRIGGEMLSYPEFSEESIFKDKNRTFIFYKPVMFRQGADDNYFRGLIRLEVSLDSIMDAIFHDQLVLLRTILIVALAATLMGIIGAFILSTLIIRPIQKLVSHIEIIRDTENKAKLDGVDIHIATKDELAILGNTINDMTHGLVKAALAASDLSIGKEIQKKFIPLDLDSHGNKQTSGFKEAANLSFFGYYEGAKGVSGDYFDYRDLDGRYYAIIKCDVAGKGIPAALIMIQVATMFLNYFKQWKQNAKGMHIEEVVYQINEFIETLAFKGRFAAFTLCLFDSATGTARFCNAGDNIVHLYDASEGRLKTITLPQSPATGVLPNFMIKSTGGYSVQTIMVDHGDILLLYTDGIEESKRKFRDSGFKEIICTEGALDTPHENHLCGQADEEMTPERVEEIINAVMARKVYILKKHHNPEGDTELRFDFSTCKGNAEEVIMAMVSVEKMFRCYKNPDTGEESRILVDKKVDGFLKNHFLQYRRYCVHTKEYPENEAYMYYTHVKEDEQYDDLTILGIKRK